MQGYVAMRAARARHASLLETAQLPTGLSVPTRRLCSQHDYAAQHTAEIYVAMGKAHTRAVQGHVCLFWPVRHPAGVDVVGGRKFEGSALPEAFLWC